MFQHKKKKRTHKSKFTNTTSNGTKTKHKSSKHAKKNTLTATKTQSNHESRPTIYENYEYDIDDLLDEIEECEEFEKQRKKWKINSKCEIYSRSKRKWFIAEISGIIFDDEGEWIVVKYNKNLVKEVQRFSDEIRPLQNRNTNINISPNNESQSHHQALIDSEAWRLMYETSQNEIQKLKDKLKKYNAYKEHNQILETQINNYKGEITILETETNCLKNEINELKTNQWNKNNFVHKETNILSPILSDNCIDFEEYKAMHRNTQTEHRKQIIAYKKQLKAAKYEKIKFSRLFENEQQQNQMYKNNINELNNKIKLLKNEFESKNEYLNTIINERELEIQQLKSEIKNLETVSTISPNQSVFDDIDKFLDHENLKLYCESKTDNNYNYNENNEYNFISPTYESNIMNEFVNINTSTGSDINDSDHLEDRIEKENGLFGLQDKRRKSLEL